MTESWEALCIESTTFMAHTLRFLRATAAERTLVYVCGPASMIDDVERVYREGGGLEGRPPLRQEQVRFERWW